MNTKLKNVRQKNGLTQEELAKKANINTRNYQRIEKGEQDTKTTIAILIDQALQITVEELSLLSQRNSFKNISFVSKEFYIKCKFV